MKLSTKGRYAARAMLDLALNFNKKPVMLKDIAKRQDISIRYLENIMSKLVSGGLVHGMRGKNGGFSLLKSPDKISLYDIIIIVEGSIAPVHCVDNPNLCGRSKECIMCDIWFKVKNAITDVFKSHILSDMVQMYNKKRGQIKDGMYYI